MKRLFYRPLFTCLLLFTLAGILFAGGSRNIFPQVSGWECSVDSIIYTPENLWDIIDGAAEVYLSYAFVDLTTAEYRRGQSVPVKAELYRHASAENAFGMYSAERQPSYHFIDIGTEGYSEEGVLNFFTGCYYVKLSTYEKGSASGEMLFTIANELQKHLGQQRIWPEILQKFPKGGKTPHSESMIPQNFLGYGFFPAVYAAEYRQPAPAQIFLMEFQSDKLARKALNNFLQKVKQISGDEALGRFIVEDSHNGIIGIALSGKHLCGILRCEDGAIRNRMLDAILFQLTQ
jgi:hypothetical protein